MCVLCKGFFVPCVTQQMHRQVDVVNRPEVFCPCPEMARHKAAVGVGALRVIVQPHTKPCEKAGSGAALC